MKIANYALSFWAELRDDSLEDETRQMLKMQNRLYLRTVLAVAAFDLAVVSWRIRTDKLVADAQLG